MKKFLIFLNSVLFLIGLCIVVLIGLSGRMSKYHVENMSMASIVVIRQILVPGDGLVDDTEIAVGDFGHIVAQCADNSCEFEYGYVFPQGRLVLIDSHGVVGKKWIRKLGYFETEDDLVEAKDSDCEFQDKLDLISEMGFLICSSFSEETVEVRQ